jgi:hypothetical protein
MIYILSAVIFFFTFIFSYKFFIQLKNKYLASIKDENLYMAFGFLALILTSAFSISSSAIFLSLFNS